ncbi:hypothetical protein GDO81_023541 [Engystomops pustulosus]|uniref:Uncharacterized protein n=1 Tax=Engystomops pustulosus TaxID=76066 RepID=A0AAV6ZMG6_ENGPU|nr:hypothetical protein GDO81_023541 [Engystomops pustulosus]
MGGAILLTFIAPCDIIGERRSVAKTALGLPKTRGCLIFTISLQECLSRLNNILQIFSKEEIQHEIYTLNTGKARTMQQSTENRREFDIRYLDESWLTRSHISRAQSVPEGSIEKHSLCLGTKKEKRSGETFYFSHFM